MADVLPYNVSHPEYGKWVTGFDSFDMENYPSEIKTLRLYSEKKTIDYDEYAVISKLIYKNLYLDVEEISIECNYQNITKPFVYSSQNKEWTCTLDVEDVTGFEFDLILQDDIGNTLRKSYQIPGKPFVVDTDNSYKYIGSDLPFGNIVLVMQDEQGNYSGGNYGEGKINQGVEGYPLLRTGNLFGPISQTKIPKNMELEVNTDLPEIQIKSVTGEKLEKDDYKITVTIDETAWDNYSEIIFRHHNKQYHTAYTQTLERGITCISFNEATGNLWHKVTDIEIWGVKDGARSNISTVSWPEKAFQFMDDANSYDNIPPVISSEYNYMNIAYAAYWHTWDPMQMYDYIAFCDAYDSPSGIDEITWTIDDGNKVYTGARYEYISYRKNNVSDRDDTSFSGYLIPVWDMDKDKVKVRLTVKDGNNNTSSFTKQVNFVKTPRFEIDLGSYDWGNCKTNLVATKVSGCNPIMFWRVGVYKLVSDSDTAYNGRWVLCDGASKNMGQIDFSNQPEESSDAYIYSNIQLPKNSFIKIVTTACWRGTTATEEYGISDSYYAYTLSEDEDSYSNFETDFLLTGDEGVIVGSNKPVFVQAYVTKRPYEEVKNWTVDDWEHRHKHVYTQLIPFSNNDRTPKFYEYPQDEIDEGDCFVVIARYATDETPVRMSKVHVKE